MKIATVKLSSCSPYSQSRHYEDVRLPKEGPDDHERRTWRERMHVDANGVAYIPPMAFKNCLSEAAKFLSIQIPGKGKSTFTKHFEAGVLVLEPMSLGVKAEDVAGEWLFVPASGRRGDGKRVSRCFPLFPEWQGEVVFHIFDDTITKEVFVEHLREAGRFIGIGRFRPRNNGFYGRFEVLNVTWA